MQIPMSEPQLDGTQYDCGHCGAVMMSLVDLFENPAWNDIHWCTVCGLITDGQCQVAPDLVLVQE